MLNEGKQHHLIIKVNGNPLCCRGETRISLYQFSVLSFWTRADATWVVRVWVRIAVQFKWAEFELKKFQLVDLELSLRSTPRRLFSLVIFLFFLVLLFIERANWIQSYTNYFRFKLNLNWFLLRLDFTLIYPCSWPSHLPCIGFCFIGCKRI